MVPTRLPIAAVSLIDPLITEVNCGASLISVTAIAKVLFWTELNPSVAVTLSEMEELTTAASSKLITWPAATVITPVTGSIANQPLGLLPRP